MKIKSFQGGYDKNLCYLIWCESTRVAAIVDPSVEINLILEHIDSNKLKLDKLIITHSHFDHIKYLDDFINLYPSVHIYASSKCKLNQDINFLNHNDVFSIGKNIVIALHTPGHYFDSMCYWIKEEEALFTGDTVFVGRTGRTISKGSLIDELYSSVYNIILNLPETTTIYPGHNYGFSKTITIKENISISNFFQCESLEEFKIIMKNFEKNRK